MRCLKPISVNGALFPCGQCIPCRLNYARQWSIRIMDEAKMSKKSCFLTLTYDEDHLPADRSICKREVQLFLKRLRKSVYPMKVRYFASGEYGEHYARPHYHLALFGIDVDSPVFLNRSYNHKRKVFYAQMAEWPNGFVAVGHLTIDSANYIAGYMVKKIKGKDAKAHYKELGIEPEFALMSRRPGIGQMFLSKYGDHIHDTDFVVVKGKKAPLPRYYRNKLFTDQERQDKALQEALEAYRRFVAKGLSAFSGEYISPELEQERCDQFVRNFNARRKLKEKPLND